MVSALVHEEGASGGVSSKPRQQPPSSSNSFTAHRRWIDGHAIQPDAVHTTVTSGTLNLMRLPTHHDSFVTFFRRIPNTSVASVARGLAPTMDLDRRTQTKRAASDLVPFVGYAAC